MAVIAGLKDFREQGSPADIGTFQMATTVLVFRFDFSGVTYVCAMGAGADGWNLIDYAPAGADDVILQAAIVYLDAITAYYKKLIIDYGTYDIQTTITAVNHLEIEIRGRLNANGCGNIIDVVGAGAYPQDIHNVYIYGGWFIGEDAGTTEAAIYIDYANSVMIERIFARDFDYGIFVRRSYHDIDLIALSITTNNVFGAYLLESNTVSVEGGAYSNTVGTGIRVYACTNTKITEATFESNSIYGIELWEPENQNTVIEKCYFEGNTGHAIYDSGGYLLTIKDSYFYDNDATYQIELVGDYAKVESCRFDGSTTSILVQYGQFTDLRNMGYSTDTNPIHIPWHPTTIFNTIRVPFVAGGDAGGIVTGNFVHADASAKGWQVDASNEWVIALLAIGGAVLNRVVGAVWYGVALGAPIGAGGHMRCNVILNASVDNDPFNTNNVAVNNQPSDSADYVANDGIRWQRFWANAGWAALANIVSNSTIEFKINYNAGSDPDGATNVVLRTFELLYL